MAAVTRHDHVTVPFFLSLVHAGFPSPADDYRDPSLDLNALVIEHPEATFYVKVTGDSMMHAAINAGDILVVDRAIPARHNSIVLALVNGEFTVKRLYHKAETVYLVPANPAYTPIKVTKEMEFQVWGVVTYCIKRLRS